MKEFVLALTVLRILAGPIIFIVSIFLEMYFLALALFLTAAATDYLDGKLARDHHVESDLGEILDPIADKLLLLFVLIVIILESHDAYIGIISCLILAREIWITGLREYAARINLKDATKVTMLGKSKTTIQFIAVAMFLLGFGLQLALLIFVAKFVLFLALLLTIKSALDYTQKVFDS